MRSYHTQKMGEILANKLQSVHMANTFLVYLNISEEWLMHNLQICQFSPAKIFHVATVNLLRYVCIWYYLILYHYNMHMNNDCTWYDICSAWLKGIITYINLLYADIATYHPSEYFNM